MNFLKLDQSFVQGIDTDPSDRAIVEAIIQLGRALDLGVIAEGIESSATIDKLLELGCHRGQGYLMSVPMSAEELAPVLRAGSIALSAFRPLGKAASALSDRSLVTLVKDVARGRDRSLRVEQSRALGLPDHARRDVRQPAQHRFHLLGAGPPGGRYQLTDAVVVLEDESLGTQAFRLGRRSVNGDSQVGSTPGVSSEPDVIPARRPRRRAQRVSDLA